MQLLRDKGVIKEIICGSNFEYVLEDNSNFANTDYKVMQSQTNGVFVQCMKMTRNGKTDLCYITNGFRPMESMFGGITADTLMAIAMNLFASVIEVRNNGFLTCQSIDLSWDKIFVEPNTFKVKLVYLPLSVKKFDSFAEFESQLRSGIVNLISQLGIEKNERMHQFIQDLKNDSLSIEAVYKRLSDAGNSFSIKKEEKNAASGGVVNGLPRLVAMNAPGYFEIVLDRENLIIGKIQELVDRVIPYNNTISRKHCRITCVNGAYFISDEGSTNGTFVNGARVAQGQCCRINRGDVVRLADSEFQIV